MTHWLCGHVGIKLAVIAVLFSVDIMWHMLAVWALCRFKEKRLLLLARTYQHDRTETAGTGQAYMQLDYLHVLLSRP